MSHVVLTVRPADHETGPRAAWRAAHADATVNTAGGYFENKEGVPVEADGTFRVCVIARNNLGVIKMMLTDHEGMVIVSEEEEPGDGLLKEAT